MTFEIPTFEPGQIVKVNGEGIEYACPHCGRRAPKMKSTFAIVVAEVSIIYCPGCRGKDAVRGWWKTSLVANNKGRLCFPWTCLEAIE